MTSRPQAQRLNCRTIIIDNLTYLCNSSDKSVDAGILMMKLMVLKKKRGLSLLIIAHTPKRDLSSPITQNHLAGSKKLYNFFDSVFAIGMSAKDNRLRYIKQVKVRAGAFKYDASNVLVYEIEKEHGFLKFNFREYATEEEHLRHRESSQTDESEIRILELSKQGLSCRKIAEEVGLSKSTVNNIIKRNSTSLSTVRQDTIPDGQTDTGQHPGTMNRHAYRLQPYAGVQTRHTCPSCGRKRCFTLYIDESGQPLADNVGRCDHESSCGYHYSPSDYFRDHPDRHHSDNQRAFIPTQSEHRIPQNPPPVKICTIPEQYVRRSIRPDIHSFLTSYLSTILDPLVLEGVIIEYQLGVTKDRSIIFFQIDRNDHCRTGKIMNCHRPPHQRREHPVPYHMGTLHPQSQRHPAS